LTRRAAEPQTVVTPDVNLYPRDTVLRALEVMHRCGVHLLPVVDEQQGEVLGHVTEEELHRIWRTLPLARMSEILSARAMLASEESAATRPSRLVFVPNQGTTWLH
jgi:predicted transcriptional regulator